MLYLSFKFVRKFKFCVSPLVKRYPGVKRIILQLFLPNQLSHLLLMSAMTGFSFTLRVSK